MSLPRERLDSLQPGMVTVLGVPSDENSSFMRGPALAPPRIREVLHSGASNLCAESGIDLGSEARLKDLGDLTLDEGSLALVPRSTDDAQSSSQRELHGSSSNTAAGSKYERGFAGPGIRLLV